MFCRPWPFTGWTLLRGQHNPFGAPPRSWMRRLAELSGGILKVSERVTVHGVSSFVPWCFWTLKMRVSQKHKKARHVYKQQTISGTLNPRLEWIVNETSSSQLATVMKNGHHAPAWWIVLVTCQETIIWWYQINFSYCPKRKNVFLLWSYSHRKHMRKVWLRRWSGRTSSGLIWVQRGLYLNACLTKSSQRNLVMWASRIRDDVVELRSAWGERLRIVSLPRVLAKEW